MHLKDGGVGLENDTPAGAIFTDVPAAGAIHYVARQVRRPDEYRAPVWARLTQRTFLRKQIHNFSIVYFTKEAHSTVKNKLQNSILSDFTLP